MTEQTELTDAQKAELAEQEKQARAYIRIEQDEATRSQTETSWKNLSTMPAGEAREFVRKTCGFDPGF